MSFIENYYKLEKKLFEEEKYKDIKLNSKVAYAILKYMLENNINIKTDKEIIKEVEVIKYVEKEKAKIWNKPNANRDTLLEFMHEGKL